MKKDIGFWGIDGVYVPDVQEVNKMETDKYFEELNDIVRDAFEPTDKEIIIDGVDVAECEHINALGKKIKCVILQDDVCEIDPYCEGCNCYYKQLKRLEQENAELKAENKELAHYLACMTEQRNKANTCLQEIKAIAECIINNEDKPACVNDRGCPLNGGDGFDNHCNIRCPFILGKQILGLITKAEEE